MTSGTYVLELRLGVFDGPDDWRIPLRGKGVQFLQATRVHDALSYCRAYSFVAVVALLGEPVAGDPVDEACELCARLSEGRPPLLALAHSGRLAEGRARLVAAGIDALLCAEETHLVHFQLETLVALAELRRFEAARTDTRALATETREQLHDLAQPLSAIQGRLQLLAAKCPSDHPDFGHLNEMVRMTFDISDRLARLQRVHREHS